MHITIKKILSLNKDGACCIIMLLDDSVGILLDCGINHLFDFSKYREF